MMVETAAVEFVKPYSTLVNLIQPYDAVVIRSNQL